MFLVSNREETSMHQSMSYMNSLWTSDEDSMFHIGT